VSGTVSGRFSGKTPNFGGFSLDSLPDTEAVIEAIKKKTGKDYSEKVLKSKDDEDIDWDSEDEEEWDSAKKKQPVKRKPVKRGPVKPEFNWKEFNRLTANDANPIFVKIIKRAEDLFVPLGGLNFSYKDVGLSDLDEADDDDILELYEEAFHKHTTHKAHRMYHEYIRDLLKWYLMVEWDYCEEDFEEAEARDEDDDDDDDGLW